MGPDFIAFGSIADISLKRLDNLNGYVNIIYKYLWNV